MAAPRWIPLESNPDVMNKFLSALGVSNITSEWKCHDVYGLDDEMLAVVPQPVLALLFLFPSSDNYKSYSTRTVDAAKAKQAAVPEGLYFTEQTVHNACGTVALIHAVANNSDKLTLASDKPLKKFLDATKEMSSEARAKFLEQDASICEAHAASASEGQTSAPNINDNVSSHFITLVQYGGELYELDGRKPIPINHGSTTSETFLKDAGKVCKGYMSNDPNEVNFTIVALAKA